MSLLFELSNSRITLVCARPWTQGDMCLRPKCKCVIRDSEKVHFQRRETGMYRWKNRMERRRTEGCINITSTIAYHKPIRWISTSCNVNVAIYIHANSYDLRSKCSRNYINTVANSTHVHGDLEGRDTFNSRPCPSKCKGSFQFIYISDILNICDMYWTRSCESVSFFIHIKV